MFRLTKLWAGLVAVFAVLLTIVIIATTIGLDYADVINDALDVQLTEVVKSDEPTEDIDTEYYKSSFGAITAENQEKLVAATLEQTVNEMREGAALLYNKEDSALPLKTETRISVFGHAAVDPAYQSSSAGTKVNNDSLNVVTLREALEAEDFELNETLWTALEGGSAKRTVGSAKGSEENKAFYEGQRSSWASDYKDAAIVVFSRQGGEGTDLAMRDDDDEGGSTEKISSLALHKNERDMLELVREDFDKVIVLLNTPNQMEVHEILPYCDAVLFMGFPGHQGFTGVAEILRGKVNPSGHLVDTYAVNSVGAPACVNSGTETPLFTNADALNEKIGEAENAENVSFQAEGIYIGYRYYETRYADCVMGVKGADGSQGAKPGATSWEYADEVSYPFGYGLSYTTFSQKITGFENGADEVTLTVEVENTGDVAGKSVVQVYAQTPYGDYEKERGIEKSAIQLAGFAKTKELKGGDKDTVTVTVDKYLLASYDRNDTKGYVLTAGDYYFAIGDDSHDALNNILAAQGYDTSDGMTENGDGSENKVRSYGQSLDTNKYRNGEGNTIVTNQFDDCDLNYWTDTEYKYLSRSDWSGTYPTEQVEVAATDAMMEYLDGNFYVKPEDAPTYDEVAARFGKDADLTIAMMRDVPITDRATWRKFIYQLDIEDLANATAESFTCPAVGELSPAFGVGDGCDSIMGNLPFKVTVDGEEVTVQSTRYCSKPILTGTFNTSLYSERGRLMGEEGLWCKKMENYNVGGNLHRTPFGGRSFEYMSECPTMAYLAAIPEVVAMEKTGSHSAPKHFTGNDQETHREGVVTFFNEQAFREGNLRAFEGALRVAGAGGLMQSFSRLGVKWASHSYALNTVVLRNEWGWTGNIVTDAAPMRDISSEGTGYKNHSPEGFAAGTEQWCLDGNGGHGKATLEIAKETNDGYLVERMVDAAISWEYAISRSCIINGMAPGDKVVPVTPWWQVALYWAIAVCAVLTAAAAAMLVVSEIKGERKEA